MPAPHLRVATVNVNGVRASLRRGLDRWLAGCGADVVALQEVRCPVAQLPDLGGWHLVYDAGERAGRNGVALLSRVEPVAVRGSLAEAGGDDGFVAEFGAEGRYVEADYDIGGLRLTAASLYVTKGGLPARQPARYERKLRFLAGVTTLLATARERALAAGRELVCGGDFNAAAAPGDLYQGHVTRPLEGYLPAERAWLTGLLADGLVDVVRALNPPPGPYSWWSWRTGAFDADRGWRIDLQLATPGLAARAVRAGTDRPATATARMSDHAPVVADYSSGSVAAASGHPGRAYEQGADRDEG